MLSTQILSDEGFWYDIITYKGHFKVIEYKERFKGLFLSETGDSEELDTYSECIKYIEERSKIYDTRSYENDSADNIMRNHRIYNG